MKRDLIIWLLTGALGASLSWNLRDLRAKDAPAPGESFSCGALEAASLDLTDSQKESLGTTCGLACSRTGELDARANAVVGELWKTLGAEELDEDYARLLADRVCEFRSEALQGCVDTIVEVRELLSNDQVGQLLKGCRLNPCGY